MPIYVPQQRSFRPANESDNLSISDIINIRKIIKHAKLSYPYHYKAEFNDTIIISAERDTSIASYDIFGSTVPESDYVQMLEALIIEANILIKHHSKYKYRKFQFDIVGSWTKGKISLFVKKEKG